MKRTSEQCRCDAVPILSMFELLISEVEENKLTNEWWFIEFKKRINKLLTEGIKNYYDDI